MPESFLTVMLVSLAAVIMTAACHVVEAAPPSHPPIRIVGNASLQAAATAGEGTYTQPYVLEGLSIDAQSSSHCVELQDVSVPFIVRASRFTGASESAVRLQNVSSGWIVECFIEGNRSGAEVRGERCEVSFARNTFRNNLFDITAACSGVQWDDGYVGNYWDRSAGPDANRDGVGDSSYFLLAEREPDETALDRFPLTEPMAGAPPTDDAQLLSISYRVGDEFDTLVESSARVSQSYLFFSSVVETQQTKRLHDRVVSAPGSGFFTLEETVAADVGTVTADDAPQLYESSVGSVTVRRMHTLGAITEPGYGVASAETAGVEMPIQLPARPVTVGDSWSATWQVGAQSLGVQQGEQRFDAVFTFTGFEEVDGEPCAVIEAVATTSTEGKSFDPLLGGTVSLVGSGTVKSTSYLSIAERRFVRQNVRMTLTLSGTYAGLLFIQQEMKIESTSRELQSGEEVVLAAPAPTQEELLQATSLLVRGEFERAERAFRDLVPRFRAAGDRVLESAAWWGLGEALARQERYREALEPFAEAEAAATSAIDRAAGLIGQGLCHRRLGEHKEALACYEKVEQLAQGDPETLSTALVDMGSCRIAMGDYEAALVDLEAALSMRRGKSPADGEINALVFTGICYRKLGQYLTALDRYQEALALCPRSSNPPYFAAYIRGNEGNGLAELGDLEGAAQSIDEAILNARRAGDERMEAGAWIQLAGCQLRAHKPEAAMASAEHALSLAATEDLKAAAEYWRGWCWLELGSPSAARTAFGGVLAWAETAGDLEATWECHAGLGKAAWQLGDLAGAHLEYEQAIGIVEKARSRVITETTRQTYFVSVRELYEQYLRLLDATGDENGMLLAAEHCRARTFLDLLAAGPHGILEQTEARKGSLEAPDLAGLDSMVSDARAAVPMDTAVLEYFVTDETSYLWLVTNDGTRRLVEIPIARAELTRRILEFRTQIEKGPDQGMVAAGLDLLALARDLYDLLLGPIEKEISATNGGSRRFSHLLIVPSGPLYYLPFAALLRCPGCEGRSLYGGTFLIQDFALSYAPSLASLGYVLQRKLPTEGGTGLLALADPETGDQTLARLPEAQEEAQAVAALFSVSDVQTGPRATEGAVRRASDSARHLLLSTHGIFNIANPMHSYLVLSPSGADDGRLYTHEIFGLSFAADLVTLSACETLLPAVTRRIEEVNAIAGERAGGEPRELTAAEADALATGDEIVGLTRAFLYAGARSVLSTLWRVQSGPTRDLMVAFYARLMGGAEKAAALRAAQREMLEALPHPLFWAAFSLIGDWK